MKYLLTTLIALIAFAFLATAPPVLAQTPDGQTPAQEMVCDPLMADGITKGLYGLCVAFCEAQDRASLSDSLTSVELEELANDAPSGKILSNYNRKKDKANNPADPGMPCIKVEEPCPCWSAEELVSVMGVDGAAVCIDFPNLGDVIVLRAMPVAPGANFQATGGTNGRTSHWDRCRYIDRRVTPHIDRLLTVGAGSLTDAEALECFAEVEAECFARGL
jgi:hypothetical protein